MSLIALVQNRTLFNQTIVVIYLLIFVYYFIRLFIIQGKSTGLVFSTANNQPVDLAVVRAISETSAKLARTSVSDQKGRFTLALPRGFYKLLVAKPELEQTQDQTIRVKSSFAPRREKIGMREVERGELHEIPQPQFQPGTAQRKALGLPVSTASSSNRTFESASDIIGRYNGTLKERNPEGLEQKQLEIMPEHGHPNWKFS